MSSNFNNFAIGNRNNPYLEYVQKPAGQPASTSSAASTVQAPLESLGASGASCPTGSSTGCMTPDPTMGPFGLLPGPMRAILDERVQLLLPPPCAMRVGMMRFGVRIVNNVFQHAQQQLATVQTQPRPQAVAAAPYENPYLPKRG